MPGWLGLTFSRKASMTIKLAALMGGLFLSMAAEIALGAAALEVGERSSLPSPDHDEAAMTVLLQHWKRPATEILDHRLPCTTASAAFPGHIDRFTEESAVRNSIASTLSLLQFLVIAADGEAVIVAPS